MDIRDFVGSSVAGELLLIGAAMGQWSRGDVRQSLAARCIDDPLLRRCVEDLQGSKSGAWKELAKFVGVDAKEMQDDLLVKLMDKKREGRKQRDSNAVARILSLAGTNAKEVLRLISEE